MKKPPALGNWVIQVESVCFSNARAARAEGRPVELPRGHVDRKKGLPTAGDILAALTQARNRWPTV